MKKTSETKLELLEEIATLKKKIKKLEESEPKQKSTSVELGDSYTKYRQFAEDMPALICSFLPDSTLTYVNNAYCELFHKRPDELVGQKFLDFLPDEATRENVRRQYISLTPENPVKTYEHKVIVSDGTNQYHWRRWTDRAFFNNECEITHFQSIGQDITERKLTEELLGQTHQNYELFFNTIDEFLFVLDEQGNIIHTNTKVIDRLGYSKEELRGQSVLMIHPPERRDEVARIVGEMLKGVTEFCPVPIITKSGVQIPVETRVSHGFWDGKPAIFGVTKDVSKVRLSEEKFSKLFHINPSACGLSDLEDRKYIEVNEAFYTLLGFTKNEVIGKTAHELGILTTENAKTILLKADGNGHVTNVEASLTAKNGDIKNVLLSAENIFIQDKKYRFTVVHDITDRKKAEEALKESEEKYRTLVENANEGILIAQDSNIAYANHQTGSILAIPVEEIIGKTFVDFIHPEDKNFVFERYKKRLAGENIPDAYEFRVINRMGETRWLHLSARQIQWNERPATLNMLTDITEHKQSEEKLKKSQELEELILSSVPHGLFGVENRVIFFANPAIKNVSGWEPDELIGKSSRILFRNDQEWKEYGSMLYSMLENESFISFEPPMPVIRKDGSEIYCRTSASRIGGDLTAGNRIVAMIEDITESKLSAESLRKSERQMADIIEFLPDATLAINKERRVIIWNKAIEEMTGVPAAEMIGKGDYAYTIPFYGDARPQLMDLVFEDNEEIAAKYPKVIREGDNLMVEVFCHSLYNNKGAWVLAKASPLHDQSGNIIGAIENIRDITERKRAENEKAKLENQLLQFQKMEAIGTLAGGIAHDFNNILAAIIGYAELAKDRNQKENKERYLQEVLMGAERARNLVKQILTFSRQDDHEKKPLDIKVLLKEAIKFLRASIPSTIEIDQHITGEDCTIMADPTQMHQVIMNLCTNASHAMKETGGTLKIELSNIEPANNEILKHPDLQQGHYVKLTVSDTGHGIDPSIVQRVFEPFFTTKPVDEGTGLGLSVVYGIVKGHGGLINVNSELGKGAAFNVYLPLIIQTETNEVDAGKSVIGGTERILFVDDEPSLVDIGMRMLFPLGYHATTATSSIEALDIFRAVPERFDLVITDMTLPKMTGTDLSREMLKIRPDIPIILCSGIKESKTEAQAKSLGIKAYLTKPLTRKELSQAIRNTIDGDEKHRS